MLSSFVSRLALNKASAVPEKSGLFSKCPSVCYAKPAKPLVKSRSILTRSTLPPNVLSAQYAVRGPLVVRAVEIEKALKKGEKFPFSRITYCNVRSFPFSIALSSRILDSFTSRHSIECKGEVDRQGERASVFLDSPRLV